MDLISVELYLYGSEESWFRRGEENRIMKRIEGGWETVHLQELAAELSTERQRTKSSGLGTADSVGLFTELGSQEDEQIHSKEFTFKYHVPGWR